MRYMNICVCIDDTMGMSFNCRRQSRDKVLIDRLLSHAEYERILVSQYSLPLFEGKGEGRVTLTRDYSEAGERDLCFFELEHITEYAERVDTILIYRWNRKYPADKKFPFSPADKGYVMRSSFDFAGNSHDKITEEVWQR